MSKENCRFHVLNEFQELSKEADQIAELPPSSIYDSWFSLVKETVLKIRDCTSIKELQNIEFFPHVTTVIEGKQRVIENVNDTIETNIGHVHAEKNVHTSEELTAIKVDKNEENSKVMDKGSLQEKSASKNKEYEYESKSSSTALCKNSNQGSQPLQVIMPVIEVLNDPVKVIPENSSGLSQRLMETPIMNRTFNKMLNNTVLLDSATANKSNQKLNLEDSDGRITRSASKLKLQGNETDSAQKQIVSGSKRKSSENKYESNKKQKAEKSDSKSATKASKSRQPHKKNPLNLGSLLPSANKVKPVIVPSVKHSTSMSTSKEKQIMVEIQKKEEKANENRKKVLAERQLKVEENKKKRNEKMEKTLQKRLQMEKEKGERLEKKDIDKKTQMDPCKEVQKPKSIMKTRTKEIIEQHMKENSSVLASKQNETKSESVFKTPNKKSSNDCETYDLTPAPDSSTYDFSDDEDKPSGKPIPLWAQGIQLRLALTHQYYNSPNVDEIFGNYIEPPNLSEIFGVQKKIYAKRTSSAVWHSPPDHSFCG